MAARPPPAPPARALLLALAGALLAPRAARGKSPGPGGSLPVPRSPLPPASWGLALWGTSRRPGSGEVGGGTRVAGLPREAARRGAAAEPGGSVSRLREDPRPRVPVPGPGRGEHLAGGPEAASAWPGGTACALLLRVLPPRGSFARVSLS